MRRRGLLLVSVLLGCSFALLTGAGGSPPAQASSWTPPTLPSGASDPYEAFTTSDVTKQYSSSDLANMIRNRIAIASSVDAPAGETAAEEAFRLSKFAKISQLLELTPDTATLTASRLAFTTSAVGALVLGGYIAYKLYQHFTSGPDNTVYYTFSRAMLGGENVWLPNVYNDQLKRYLTMDAGDFQACVEPGHQGLICNNGASPGYNMVGWARVNVNSSVVPGGHAWVFSDAMEYGIGCYKTPCGTGQFYPYFGPGGSSAQQVPQVRGDAFEDPQYCVGATNGSQCAGSASTAADNAGPPPCQPGSSGFYCAPYAALQAQWKTYNSLIQNGSAQAVTVSHDDNAFATGHLLSAAGASACELFSVSQPCHAIYFPDTALDNVIQQRTSNPNADGDLAGTQTYNVPATAGNATDRASLPSDPCTRQTFNWLIDPAHYSYPGCTFADPTTVPPPPPPPPPTTTFQPFALPAVETGETYAQYVQRLRALGWLGTATLTDESALESSATAGSDYTLAPLGAPTVIVVGSAVPVDVYSPLGQKQDWPVNPPEVSTPTEEITIAKKPPTTVFPPPPPGSGPTGINFGPLTSLDPGCKFPYGFVCYATDVTNWFSVTPVAPVFDFTIPCPALAPCTNYEFGPVNLDIMDSWASTWRTILSIVLWIGAVYILASRFLGVNAAGDPGEAMDDAWID